MTTPKYDVGSNPAGGTSLRNMSGVTVRQYQDISLQNSIDILGGFLSSESTSWQCLLIDDSISFCSIFDPESAIRGFAKLKKIKTIYKKKLDRTYRTSPTQCCHIEW